MVLPQGMGTRNQTRIPQICTMSSSSKKLNGARGQHLSLGDPSRSVVEPRVRLTPDAVTVRLPAHPGLHRAVLAARWARPQCPAFPRLSLPQSLPCPSPAFQGLPEDAPGGTCLRVLTKLAPSAGPAPAWCSRVTARSCSSQNW